MRHLFIIAAWLLAWLPSQAESANDLVALGDGFDRTFQAAKALQHYLPAEKLDPQNVPLLLRIARQYRHLMTDATPDTEKLRLGCIALTYGLRAAALAPNDSEAQLSPAITYGKMLPLQGSKEQVDASPRIKAATERSIRLDPRNDIAWHVLGRWHQALANVSGLKRALGGLIYGKLPTTTNEAAVACFDKAIAINPNRLRNYIELGRTYAQMGKNVEARQFIQKGMSMPNMEHDDPELKQRGRDSLAKLP
jgi:tetratricopeptide (TPR) repeat protein